MLIPQDYTVQKFYQYAGYPKYKKISQVYEGSCPICREGKSWGKKKRCFYLVKDNVICCHNCGWYSSPFKWIQQVSGLSVNEIYEETKSFDILPQDVSSLEVSHVVKRNENKLPLDSINLLDKTQTDYYNNNKVITDTLNMMTERRLLTAVNRPDSLWISLTDSVHKNRLTIPFYDEQNNICFYQSRQIYPSKKQPKYLGKVNGDRSLFNLNKITPEIDYIFIFEGPIDAFFVRNGIAVAGIQEHSEKHFTHLQEQQISRFNLYTKIWVLDNQWLDTASKIKTKHLIETGERVFIWPESLKKQYKDINELCIAAKRDEIDPGLFVNNSYTDLKAKLLLANISH